MHLIEGWHQLQVFKAQKSSTLNARRFLNSDDLWIKRSLSFWKPKVEGRVGRYQLPDLRSFAFFPLPSSTSRLLPPNQRVVHKHCYVINGPVRWHLARVRFYDNVMHLLTYTCYHLSKRFPTYCEIIARYLRASDWNVPLIFVKVRGEGPYSRS